NKLENARVATPDWSLVLGHWSFVWSLVLWFLVLWYCLWKMTKPLLTTDIRGQLILLGTGTSVGVPSIGCGCEVCTSTDPRDKRTRCAALVGLPEGNLLIDTPPDLRQQLLRERVGIVHAAAFTHEHAD